MAFVVSMMAFAALSMSVWAHHMFVTGGVTNQYFAFTSTLLVVPAGIEYFDLIGTLIGGAIVLRCSMLFALAFFIQFLIGGLSGIFVASPVLDYSAYGTYVVVAHFHYTLFAGSVFGFFAGVYHWFPKITGARLRERLGKRPPRAAGDRHEHDVLPDVRARRGRHAAAHLALSPRIRAGRRSTGSRPIGAGSSRSPSLSSCSTWSSRCAGASPRATTRGSATRSSGRPASPPPPHNFERPLPPIRSYAPLLDLREAAEPPGRRACRRAA